MIFDQFESLLKRTIGLNAAAIGASGVERAVQARLAACKLEDAQAYREYIRNSAEELQALVEAVVIPETWFFRDREAFTALVGMAQEKCLTSHTRVALRLLSLPCATGEEPYSMAMALLDAGVPAERLCIHAVDISARALAHAECAVYGKNSFRGNELGFRDRYFAATPRGYQLAEIVRTAVRFKQGNLFNAPVLLGAEVYDFIFCRNLLIYFDTKEQERAVDLLTRPLSAQGVLFVGPSEASLLVNRDFVSAKIPLAFAFHKAIVTPPAAKSSFADPGKRYKAPGTEVRASRPIRTSANLRGAPAPPAEPIQQLTIEEIRRIADQGRLAEAAQRCEEYLRDHEPLAAALHLLGLICDAMGNLPEAADRYRKALYLDPNHQQALVHLALLLEKQGDATGAKALNDRSRRLDRLKSKNHA